MTRSAEEFITPLTLQALSGNRVSTELLDAEAEAAMGHIELAKWADGILLHPLQRIQLLGFHLEEVMICFPVTLAFDGPISVVQL